MENTAIRWFTSSYSSANAECVEAAFIPGRALLRDSKIGEGSPILTFGVGQWASFTAGITAEAFDLNV